MILIKGRNAFLTIVGLALVSVVSLSACQQGRIGPNPTIVGQDNQETFGPPPDEATPIITPEAEATSDPIQLYSNSNTGPVKVGATAPATFTVESGSVRVTGLTTYHYVEPKGVASSGDVGIVGSSGHLYGIWTTTGLTGQDGVKNASWVAMFDIVLTPGTYTITDTDPSTWSSNSGTGGAGMFWIYGYRLG